MIVSTDSIIIPTGRRMAEVSWPAYSRRRGGTCDFMTAACKKHCVLTTNEVEKNSLAFFEDNEPPAIVRRIIDEINELKASVLCWFVGSGDCPERMTNKLVEIVTTLSGLKIRQNGFTRNISFWSAVSQVPRGSFVLTIEKGDKDLLSRTTSFCSSDKRARYLVGEPNYSTRIVRIFRLGMKEQRSYRCGGGWVAEYRANNLSSKTMVEDCSLCLENNDGCFSLADAREEK